jgi:hypothetical protein
LELIWKRLRLVTAEGSFEPSNLQKQRTPRRALVERRDTNFLIYKQRCHSDILTGSAAISYR